MSWAGLWKACKERNLSAKHRVSHLQLTVWGLVFPQSNSWLIVCVYAHFVPDCLSEEHFFLNEETCFWWMPRLYEESECRVAISLFLLVNCFKDKHQGQVCHKENLLKGTHHLYLSNDHKLHFASFWSRWQILAQKRNLAMCQPHQLALRKSNSFLMEILFTKYTRYITKL